MGLILNTIVFMALAARAEDLLDVGAKDKTEISAEKPAAPAKPAPAKLSTKELQADLYVRKQVRKAAPFWIADDRRGVKIRVQKDGSFSTDANKANEASGSWRIHKGKLVLKWADLDEEQTFHVQLRKKGKPLINGVAAKETR